MCIVLVPAEASLKHWICWEANTFIYVWYHAENEQPTWYPKRHSLIENKTYPNRCRLEYRVNDHLQVVTANKLDFFPVFPLALLWMQLFMYFREYRVT